MFTYHTMLRRRMVYSQAHGQLYRELCTRLRVNPAGLFVSDGSFLRATQTVEVKFIKSKSHARYIFSHGYSLYFFSFLLICGGLGVGVLGLGSRIGFLGSDTSHLEASFPGQLMHQLNINTCHLPTFASYHSIQIINRLQIFII